MTYLTIGLLLALLIGISLYAPSSYEGFLVALSVLVAFGAVAVIEYRRLKEYGYDEKGVYRWNKLMFSWTDVRKISLNFKESSHTVTTIALPSIRTIISGPLINRATWVDYGISTVFTLDNGSTISIPSNLDRMVDKGIVEDIHEVSRAANSSIEID